MAVTTRFRVKSQPTRNLCVGTVADHDHQNRGQRTMIAVQIQFKESSKLDGMVERAILIAVGTGIPDIEVVPIGVLLSLLSSLAHHQG